MTIDSDARPIFDTLGFSRNHLLLVAKSLAQDVIDDSRAPVLCGLVYDVRGLYNDGQPKCRWTAPFDDTDDIVFSGQFRVEKGEDAKGTFVSRRLHLSPADLEERVQTLKAEGMRV